MVLISVVVITYNEEENIGRCLQSVQRVADEIIVVDAFSTDKTVEIARSKGARVRQAPFAGYVQQKNYAVSLASNDYVLSLDADEALDEVLAAALCNAKDGLLTAGAYFMNRCTSYCGKYIRHGSWYPDKKVRLFDRRVAGWTGTDLHEKITLHGKNVRTKQLPGDILHYSFSTIEDHVKKCDRYSSILAASLFARGKRSSWFKILANPFWAFFHGYIIRRGFVDGYHGFVIAINSAHATFLKYAKLYKLQSAPQQAPTTVNNTSVNITAKPVSELR